MLNQFSAVQDQNSDKIPRSKFSLRSLSILLLMVTVFCSAPIILQNLKTQSLQKTIHNNGGNVHFSNNLRINNFSLTLPSQMRPLLGNMTYISLPGTTDEFINELGNQPDLVNLSLGSPPYPSALTDTGLTTLKMFPLKTLELSGGTFTASGFAELGKINTLRRLHLSNINLSGEILSGVATLKNVEDLRLSNLEITDTGMKIISQLPSLECLTLQKVKFEDSGFRQIANLKYLQSLTIESTNLDADEFHSLVELESLIDLHLKNLTINDEHLGHIAELKSLKNLCFDNTQISDHGLIQLSNLSNLERLTLRNTGISGFGFKHLAKAESLSYLAVTGKQISDLSQDSLLNIPQLKVFSARYTKITPAVVQSLRNHLIVDYYNGMNLEQGLLKCRASHK